MSLTIPISLLVTHFVADFILQSDWMALNKSKNNKALYLHAFVYSLCFLPFGFWFFLATFFMHFTTDYYTSRITSKLWFFKPWQTMTFEGENNQTEERIVSWVQSGGSRHWFFVMIGFDQLLHYFQLALTYKFLGGI